MKKIFMLLLVAGLHTTVKGQTKIGDNPGTTNTSALLELESTNKGLLPPRIALTDTVAWGLAGSPTNGMMVYNTATVGAKLSPGLYTWKNTAWLRQSNGDDNSWKKSGSDLVNTNTGFVGIGIPAGTTLNAKLHVFANSTNGQQEDDIVTESVGASAAPSFITYRERGTAASKSNLITNDFMGSQIFFGRANSNDAGASSTITSFYRGSGTTNSTALTFATSGTEKMRLDENGYVGIGNTAPLSPLTVTVNATTGLVDDDIRLEAFENVVGGPALVMSRARGTSGNPQNVAANDILGGVVMEGRAGGSTGATNSTIMSYYRGNGSTNLNELRFATSGADRVTIGQTGFVGIGTTSPATPLTVSSAAGSAGISQTDGTHKLSVITGIDGATIGTTTNHPLNLMTNSLKRVTIDNNGNMGLNTVLPTSTLHNNGSFSLPVTTTTGNYAATENDFTIIADASGDTNTVYSGPYMYITLPVASTCPGRIYLIHFNWHLSNNYSLVYIQDANITGIYVASYAYINPTC